MRHLRAHLWTLNGKVPEACIDVIRWANWFEANFYKRHVADTYLADEAVRISTVFLAVDQNFSPNGPPVTFETMIFGGTLTESMWRYATWDDAQRGHDKCVALASAALTTAEQVAGLQMQSLLTYIREHA